MQLFETDTSLIAAKIVVTHFLLLLKQFIIFIPIVLGVVCDKLMHRIVCLGQVISHKAHNLVGPHKNFIFLDYRLLHLLCEGRCEEGT